MHRTPGGLSAPLRRICRICLSTISAHKKRKRVRSSEEFAYTTRSLGPPVLELHERQLGPVFGRRATVLVHCGVVLEMFSAGAEEGFGFGAGHLV